MELPQTGGCQCGKIRYEITEAPTLIYTCHCRDCQRLTSAFSLGIVVAAAGFRLSGIEPRPLQRMADSGRTNTPVGPPGVRLLDLRPAEGRRGARSGGHARRYDVAKTHPAYLDPEQAALDHVRRGRSDFRGAATRIGQTLIATRSKRLRCLGVERHFAATGTAMPGIFTFTAPRWLRLVM